MTQKYLYVRRELYEQNPAKKLNLFRSFAEMAKIFTWLPWVLLGLMVISITLMIISLFLDYILPLTILSFILLVFVAFLLLILREKHLYHEPARKAELELVRKNYREYIAEVQKILENQEINSPEKILKLKQECEAALVAHSNQFNTARSRVYDLLIGVPLGALISGIIFADKEVALVAIVFIVFLGFVIVEFTKIARVISFYTDGYFKDKYLLDALNELEYSNEIYEKC